MVIHVEHWLIIVNMFFKYFSNIYITEFEGLITEYLIYVLLNLRVFVQYLVSDHLYRRQRVFKNIW